ncbi:uncharacterized protein LOC117328010 [Pecten maximus]|uniref:uncharacterized protein LOC117328010 n=1 Tax=Pecten maximus TaxID=6579 RepID=UPI001457E8C9|nr:uncharacterized protein LOC117328010 [Pecten maximus]
MLSITVFLVCLALGGAQTNGICDDINSMICQDLYNLNPNMCANSCYSVALCPRFCGKCPLKCYQCHEVSSPDQCFTSTQCPSVDHFCITTQSFTDDFKEVYKLGCAPNTVCTSHFGPAIGRRQDDSVSKRGILQGSCCDTDLCNVKSRNVTTAPANDPMPSVIVRDEFELSAPTTGNISLSTSIPTTNSSIVTDVQSATMAPAVTLAPVVTSAPVATALPVVTPVCDDVDADICSRLALNFPDMCTIDCIANDVCPRKCGKCMGCYQCSHVPVAETCSHKTVCAAGEQCYTVETISASLERGYRMGCLNEKLCSSFGEAAPDIFGKRQAFELSLHGGCCKGDYCNHHALLPTTTPPPTTTMAPTTPSPTTPHKYCPSRHNRCPSEWIHHQTSCYALSLTAVSWADAKATCERLCGKLADFSSSADLQHVLQDLGKYLYTQAGLSGTAWVDGHVSHQEWVLSNGHEADHSLSHDLHNSDSSKCGSVSLGIHVFGHHVNTPSHYLDPSDCQIRHLPLCEIEHVYS